MLQHLIHTRVTPGFVFASFCFVLSRYVFSFQLLFQGLLCCFFVIANIWFKQKQYKQCGIKNAYVILFLFASIYILKPQKSSFFVSVYLVLLSLLNFYTFLQPKQYNAYTYIFLHKIVGQRSLSSNKGERSKS